ncbi:MAG TPA: hypothetical protein VIL69_01255 [Roseomonas sp.]|jgi:hypothetical protein
MATPSFVYTITYAAELLGEEEKWLLELADQLEPGNGCLWIYDNDDRAMLGVSPNAGSKSSRNSVSTRSGQRGQHVCAR